LGFGGPLNAADDKFFNAVITKRADFAPDLWMIRVRVDGDFNFIPGQYASLRVETPERHYERPYSIASSPLEDEVEFFFELVPHGDLTPKLYDLQTGDRVLMRKVPKGRFTLDTTLGRTNHLLVCTVTGVAPFVSFVRTLKRQADSHQLAGDHKLYLINGASRSWEFGYMHELQQIAKEVPWLTYVPTISRPWDDEKWMGETGRADDLLRKYTDNWGLTADNSIAYLCGHPEMVEHCKGILKRIGFERQCLREEIYWVPPKAAAPAT
jgi:ferredoxin--NADP+ reductase